MERGGLREGAELRRRNRFGGGEEGWSPGDGGDHPKDWEGGCSFPNTWSGWWDLPCRYHRPLMPGGLGGAEQVWKATQGRRTPKGLSIYRLPV